MAFDPDAYLSGGTAVKEFDPDAYLAADVPSLDPQVVSPEEDQSADEHDFLYYKTGKTKSEREALNAPLREAMQVPAVAPETITRVLQALNTTDEQGPVQQGIDESIARAGSAMTTGEGVASLPLYIFPPTAVGLQAENTAELPAQVGDAIERARQGDIKGAASTGTDALLNALMTIGVVHGGAKFMGGERVSTPLRAEPTLAERITQPRVEPVVEEPLAPVTPEVPPEPPAAAPQMPVNASEAVVPSPVAEAAPPAPAPMSPGAAKQLRKLKAHKAQVEAIGGKVDPDKVTAKIAEIEGVPQPERIAAAATQFPDGTIKTGPSHAVITEGAPLPQGAIDGFVTNTGRFVGTSEAHQIAIQAGQAMEAKNAGLRLQHEATHAPEAPVQAQEGPSLASEAPGGVPVAGDLWYSGVGPEGGTTWVTSNLEKAKIYAGRRGEGGRINVYKPEQVGENAFADAEGNLMSPQEYAKTQSEDTALQVPPQAEGKALPTPFQVLDASGKPIEPPPPGAGATHYIGGVIPENPRLPIFTTTKRTGAEWYARERGTGGQVHEIEVEAKNPLKLFNEQQVHDNLLPVLDEAGVKYKFTPSSKTIGWDLEIPDIAKHSPYYGENHLDVAYIPQVREALVKRGYDSIQASDVLENREIPTTVLIKDPNQMTRKPPPPGAGALRTTIATKSGELPIRDPSENVTDTLKGHTSIPAGARIEYVPIRDISGGKTRDARVSELTREMGGGDGYISRIIVDAKNNVVEGQHRLEALRNLGATEAPVVKIFGAEDFIPDTNALKNVIKHSGIKHSDQVNQMVSHLGEVLMDEGGKVAELRSYDAPKGFEKAWDAAITEIERQQPPPPGAGAPPEVPPSERGYAGMEPLPQKPSKIGQSIEAKAVEAKLTKGFPETAGYDPITIKDQAARASELVKQNPSRAGAIIRGEEPLPAEIRGTSLITAMEEHLLRNPSAQGAYELANSRLVSLTSEAAQEMRLMAERVPDGITAKFAEIKAAREEGAALRKETKAKVKKEINGEVVKAASKRPTWEAFVREIVC